jgi:hypothetical protein
MKDETDIETKGLNVISFMIYAMQIYISVFASATEPDNQFQS